MTVFGVFISEYSGLPWLAVFGAAWLIICGLCWCMCRVAGKADEAAGRK